MMSMDIYLLLFLRENDRSIESDINSKSSIIIGIHNPIDQDISIILCPVIESEESQNE